MLREKGRNSTPDEEEHLCRIFLHICRKRIQRAKIRKESPFGHPLVCMMNRRNLVLDLNELGKTVEDMLVKVLEFFLIRR